MTASDGQGIREELETLAEVSRDLDRHAKLSKTAHHPIQAQQVRKRIDELTAQQTKLMTSLVERHTNEATKAKFNELSDKLDQLRVDIRACEDKETLAEFEAKIDESVTSWVHQFQIIVSELSGIAPPSKPVFDN